MHNGIINPTITLSTGKTYTPKEGEPPVSPCWTCKEKSFEKWSKCKPGFGVCSEYMDYEHMNCVYKTSVF